MRPPRKIVTSARAWSSTKKPVAHVLTAPIDRHRPAFQSIDDEQRNKLFGKLIRAEVVRAIADQHRQAVGLMPGGGQVVGPRLARRIWRVRPIRRVLRKSAVLSQRTIDLICRYMKKTKARLFRRRQCAPMVVGRAQQGAC